MTTRFGERSGSSEAFADTGRDALFKIIVQQLEFDQLRIQSEGYVTHNRPAVVHKKDQDWVASWQDDDGNSREGILERAPAIPIKPSSVELEYVSRRDPVPPRQSSEIVADCSLSPEERMDAFLDWASNDNSAAADYLLDVISGSPAHDSWLSAVVFAAEALRFDGAERQRRATDRLLDVAWRLRESSAPEFAETVWAAIHRAGSLIEEERVFDLEKFLSAPVTIDTRLAALQSIVHVFEVSPPDETLDFKALKDRVSTLAKTWLNPDVFIAGDISALAIEATVAQAVLDDERLPQTVDAVIQLQRRWLCRELGARLNELESLWIEAGIDQTSPCFERVRAACAVFRGH